MNKLKLSLSIAIGSVILYTLTNIYTPEHKKMTKIHKLEYPLLISSDNSMENVHLLPKGTVLYFDKAFPEGFTRYKVYINIDRMPLKLDELQDPTEIAPIDAAAPNKEDLAKLIRNYPLTKSDLESILNSKRISKEEIKEVFEKYVR